MCSFFHQIRRFQLHFLLLIADVKVSLLLYSVKSPSKSQETPGFLNDSCIMCVSISTSLGLILMSNALKYLGIKLDLSDNKRILEIDGNCHITDY